ncbi:E3 ubiquitin-protein ligase TRIM7-like [Tachysurus fulvidraco]|uniref:E3 ubiquitin-protein ligase TRIM7-like n=1 Tax=Tachysurus fulvidraco TaxID=1234273 RepID=UPI001FEE1B52|nr:E3 ubiquitin-protein ligase TRIM7-like [Tachysurus fulvidraco]
MMEEKQKTAERQAEGLIKELEKEINVLKRRETELEQLSHTEEHLHVLQIYSSMCSPCINTDVSGDTVRTALSQLQQTLNEKLTKSLNDKLKETVSTELKRIQQYAVDVTLDSDTANPDLILSADGKQVTHGDKRQNLEVVGVFVDYEEGLVSFYDVKSRSHIYSFTGQTFTEELYPYFGPGLNEGGKNAAPLIIFPVFKTEYI